MKNNNLLKELSDIWTDDAISSRVQEDLTRYQLKTGKIIEFPIYPEEIAEKIFEISFKYPKHVFDTSGNEVLARFDPVKKTIEVNDSVMANKGQGSFTLAHEVGHASMHAFMTPIYCAGPGDERSRRMLEKQADKYASLFLMPENLMNTAIRSLVGRGFPINLDLVSPQLVPLLKVSRQALEIRLGNLGYKLINSKYGVNYERTHDKLFLELEEERQSRGMV